MSNGHILNCCLNRENRLKLYSSLTEFKIHYGKLYLGCFCISKQSDKLFEKLYSGVWKRKGQFLLKDWDSWRHCNGIKFAFSFVQLEFKTETDNCVSVNKWGKVGLWKNASDLADVTRIDECYQKRLHSYIVGLFTKKAGGTFTCRLCPFWNAILPVLPFFFKNLGKYFNSTAKPRPQKSSWGCFWTEFP